MYNIAVIGAGQLGSRHLQGLAGVSFPCNLHVIDPYEKSLTLALERLREVEAKNVHEVFLHKSSEKIPDLIDLAVIATTSDIRMKAIEELLSSRIVKNLVLEKVLFQSFSEYAMAANLMQINSVNSWVNCPRRLYPVYENLKKFWGNEPIIYMDVHGGDWGLGCNGIHFLDLLAFIYPGEKFYFECGGLDKESRTSKRAGFIEFTGTLRGTYGQTTLNLTSVHKSKVNHLITLRGEKKSVVIDEEGGASGH
jgi:predicted dehydrogenase